jgi:hypothetical protein
MNVNFMKSLEQGYICGNVFMEPKWLCHNNKVNRMEIYCWLAVSTPLKHISQLGCFFPIYEKIKNVPNHQPDY